MMCENCYREYPKGRYGLSCPYCNFYNGKRWYPVNPKLLENKTKKAKQKAMEN